MNGEPQKDRCQGGEHHCRLLDLLPRLLTCSRVQRLPP